MSGTVCVTTSVAVSYAPRRNVELLFSLAPTNKKGPAHAYRLEVVVDAE